MRGISWLAESQLASQEGLWYTEWVNNSRTADMIDYIEESMKLYINMAATGADKWTLC